MGLGGIAGARRRINTTNARLYVRPDDELGGGLGSFCAQPRRLIAGTSNSVAHLLCRSPILYGRPVSAYSLHGDTGLCARLFRLACLISAHGYAIGTARRLNGTRDI